MLRLLATDLTGPDIAGQLFMSVNASRTHTRHIFIKLDVNTRRAAVSRARDPDLFYEALPSPGSRMSLSAKFDGAGWLSPTRSWLARHRRSATTSS